LLEGGIVKVRGIDRRRRQAMLQLLERRNGFDRRQKVAGMKVQ
jgi:hypothetical protein